MKKHLAKDCASTSSSKLTMQETVVHHPEGLILASVTGFVLTSVHLLLLVEGEMWLLLSPV